MNSRYSLYLNAFIRVIEQYEKSQEKHIKQAVFYGVKVINLKPKEYSKTANDYLNDFQLIGAIKSLIAKLTPGEFINLFPIEKTFDGQKWGVKDFFYTKEYISSLEQEKPIGDKIDRFLMEYTNKDIEVFMVKSMICLSKMRQLQGQPSIAKEWADSVGLKTYTMHTDSKGKKFVFDSETGKTNRIRKPLPKYLKVVK